MVAVLVISLVLFLRAAHSNPLSASDGSEKKVEDADRLTSPRGQNADQKSLQHALNLPGTSLDYRLRYHFPYRLESKFPAYIWQTWKYLPSSVWFREELRPMEASWTELHPGFVHEVITDDMQEHLIKYLYAALPEVCEAFTSMPLPVLKADYFRYLILLARGGIYSDIDTTALQPASSWLPVDLDLSTIGLIIGIEADPDRPDWHDWYSRRIQFCQWTIQAKPGHPLLRDMVRFITEEALRMKKADVLRPGKMDRTVVEFTGPGAWTDTVFRYLNNPNYFHIEPGTTGNITYTDFTNQKEHKKVGDVVILPLTSFSPGVQQMGAGEDDDPMAFVKHEFEGSWKTDPAL